MELFKTIDEIVNFVGTKNIGYISFQRKNTNEHHDGHAHLVNYAKNNYDLVVAAYWDHMEFIDNLFGDTESIYRRDINPVWDQSYCTSWCSNQGVDIMLVPNVGYSQIYFSGCNIQDLKNTINTIYDNEGYNNGREISSSTSLTIPQTIKSKMMSIYFNDRGWTTITSAKDGYWRYVAKHFLENYTTSKYEILEPLKRPDGLYYSSSLNLIPSEKISLVSQIPTKMNSVTSQQNIFLLKDEINSIDVSEENKLRAYRIEKYYNPKIHDETIIDVYFEVDDISNVFSFQIKQGEKSE